MPQSAEYVLVDGVGGPNGERRMVKVFDLSGKELANFPSTLPPAAGPGSLSSNPDGSLATVGIALDGPFPLLKMPSGRQVGSLHTWPASLNPSGDSWAYAGTPPGASKHGVWLYEEDKDGPVVGLGLDPTTFAFQVQFDPTGRLLAWGNTDGSVSVCDLPTVRAKLAELELDW